MGGPDGFVWVGREEIYIGDLVIGGPGDDFLEPGPSTGDTFYTFEQDRISFDDSPRGVVADLQAGTASGHGQDTLVVSQGAGLVGSPHADVLWGTDGADLILGGSGRDEIHGRAGGDHLVGPADALGNGRGGDSVWGGAGGDSVWVGFDRDVVRSGIGPDEITDLGGRPRIYAGDGRDEIVATVRLGPRRQSIEGGAHRDVVDLGVVNRTNEPIRVLGRISLRRGRMTVARGGDDFSMGFAGVESLTLSAGRWTVRGSAADEDLRLTAPRSRLVARMGAGDDAVVSGAGDDELFGGPGRDTVRPGRGVDTCRGFEIFSRPCENVSRPLLRRPPHTSGPPGQ